MEKINIVFEFRKGTFSHYKFTSLWRFVRFLWNTSATMEFFTPMSKIPGAYVIASSMQLSDEVKIACDKFGLKILEGMPTSIPEISVIGKYLEDPSFDNLFQEIQSEAKKNYGKR